ncbi:MAG: hypothetical protein HRT57_12820 [Crocinitomicaceae bacterium]|nr:hypothetical protein [Crocinitomicaceae bacterium]
MEKRRYNKGFHISWGQNSKSRKDLKEEKLECAAAEANTQAIAQMSDSTEVTELHETSVAELEAYKASVTQDKVKPNKSKNHKITDAQADKKEETASTTVDESSTQDTSEKKRKEKDTKKEGKSKWLA